jgi:hypothetical protein
VRPLGNHSCLRRSGLRLNDIRLDLGATSYPFICEGHLGCSYFLAIHLHFFLLLFYDYPPTQSRVAMALTQDWEGPLGSVRAQQGNIAT